MNELTITNYQGQFVVDSREVADMVGKDHKNLLRDIKGYAEILTSAKLSPLDFFIDSTYQDAKKETRPCYLITKKGCDMVANKMTGEKGVIFTAMYVTKFEEMEATIKSKPQLPISIEDMIIAQAQSVKELKSQVQDIEVQSTFAQEKALEAHDRLDKLDRIDPNGNPRQQLNNAVRRFAERNGITYAEGWRQFRSSFNTAFQTNVTLRIKHYCESRGIKKLSVPEYLEATNQIQDGLRVAGKMICH